MSNWLNSRFSTIKFPIHGMILLQVVNSQKGSFLQPKLTFFLPKLNKKQVITLTLGSWPQSSHIDLRVSADPEDVKNDPQQASKKTSEILLPVLFKMRISSRISNRGFALVAKSSFESHFPNSIIPGKSKICSQQIQQIYTHCTAL